MKKARNIVRHMNVRYTKVAMARVGANIFLACVHGPYRKHVAQMLMMLPVVYIVANGTGLPSSSVISRIVLPIEIKKPTTMNMRQPPILC